jgi:hypothetical protein
MKPFRFQIVAAIVATLAIGFVLGWADRTVHGFADGKVNESQFQTALSINGLFGLPLQLVLFATATLVGGFSISMNVDGSTPSWLIWLGSALWGVIIFVGLFVATRLWRRLGRTSQNEKA